MNFSNKETPTVDGEEVQREEGEPIFVEDVKNEVPFWSM